MITWAYDWMMRRLGCCGCYLGCCVLILAPLVTGGAVVAGMVLL